MRLIDDSYGVWVYFIWGITQFAFARIINPLYTEKLISSLYGV